MARRWWRTLGGLHVELLILAFCGLILSGTGKTRGPVFDAIGPDVLPTAVALIVAGLTLVQAMHQILRGTGTSLPAASEPIAWGELLRGLAFGVATVAYVALLAWRLAPFWVATAAFVAMTTLIMANPRSWRDAAAGAGIGAGLGIFLQLVFTRVLVIDLPT